MSADHCDALVFYGATGDLAYKKIFPSLQAMAKRGTLIEICIKNAIVNAKKGGALTA